MPSPIASRPDAPPLPRLAAHLMDRLRREGTRVHAITNTAAQAFTANLLLAAGAAPSLTTAPDEAQAFTARAGALLVNLGTL
ncbi:MAG TPA: hydroxyethylthiazole kinase, partial [Microvirga sp.]|nr:hydroxyethylthiazole kinase [Microvirga sp.]